MMDPKAKAQQLKELLVKLKNHKQEAIDCLIASRASYEPTLDGVADVLERSYEVDTGRYELIYHKERPTLLSARPLDNQEQVYIIVRSSNGYVIVAFRGTFTFQDAIQAMKMATVPMSFGAGKAHVGVHGRCKNLPIELFQKLLMPGEKLILTGHSLGGAIASLTALQILEKIQTEGVDGSAQLTKDRILCVTFGTAPFANRDLAMYINSKYKDRFYHLISRHDFVPRVNVIFPEIFFPLARYWSKRIRESTCIKKFLYCLEHSPMAGITVHKRMKQLETLLRSHYFTDIMVDFVKDCIANDEEAVFYDLHGYILLFNPDAKDSERIVEVDGMLNMKPGNYMEGKSTLETVSEHGLGNHYSMILRGLYEKVSSTSNKSKQKMSLAMAGYTTLNKSMKILSTSIMPFLSDPTSATLHRIAQMLQQMTNNDFYSDS